MGLHRSMSMKRRSEFLRVKRRGKSFAGRYMVLSILPDDELSSLRVGLIVTRKFGHAADRNRFRRRLREVIRPALPELPSQGYMVLIARKPAANASLDQLNAEWRRLAKKAKFFKAEAV